MNEMILLCVQSGLHFEKCSSNRRKQYHLVAVLLNNFVNHLVYLSQEEANKRGLSWDVLEPLLEKTLTSIKQSKAKEKPTKYDITIKYTDKDMPFSIKILLIKNPFVARLTVTSIYGAIDPNMELYSLADL